MSSARTLRFRTGVDLSGWSRDLRSGTSDVESWIGKTQGVFDSLKAPNLAEPKRSAPADVAAGPLPGADLAGAIKPLGATIKTAIGDAAKPLQDFSTRFERNFDEMGATVEALAIRIDSAMRFPVFVGRVDAFRKALMSRFGSIEKESVAKIDAIAGHEADASKLVGSFTKATDDIKKAVAPVPKDVGYALEAATHVPSGGFKSYIAAVKDGTSEAIDRMKALAAETEKAMSGRASGKGSINFRKRIKGNAAGVAATQSAAPKTDNTTAASKIKITAYDRIRSAVNALRAAEKTSSDLLHKIAKQDAGDVNRMIGAWLGFKKVRNELASLGSVAKATFSQLHGWKVPKLIDPRESAVLKGLGGAARSAGSGLGALAVAGAAAAGVYSAAFSAANFLKDGIVSASSLNETLSKTDAVLGSASGGVKAFADELGSKFGLIKQETLDTASGFGALFKAGGQSGAGLESSTKQFTMLAADLSSFANLGFTEAGDALRSALSGNESDALKKIGVFTDEATVKAYAYSHGIAKVGTELTAQEKIMARSGAIMLGLKDAQGDLEKTSGSTANQFRKFQGNITNLGTSIGTALLPAVDAALGLFNNLATWATSAFDSLKSGVGGLVESLTSGFSFLASAVTHPQAAFEVLRLVALQTLTNIGEYLDTLPDNFGIVTSYISKNWLAMCRDLGAAYLTWVKNSFKNLQALGTAIGEFVANPTKGFKPEWTNMLDGFQSTAEKLPDLIKPALTDMSKEIAAAAQPIWDDVKRKADEAKSRADAAKKSAVFKSKTDLAEGGAGKTTDLQKFAKKTFEDTRTPIEKFGEDVAKLQQALDAKLINLDTFNRGKSASFADNKLDEKHFAGAVDSSSTEAYSQILAATTGRAKSAQNVERINRDQLNVQRETLRAINDQGRGRGKGLEVTVSRFGG